MIIDRTELSIANIYLEGIDVENQYEKLSEELDEFEMALAQGNDEDVMEEMLDVFQVLLGIIWLERKLSVKELSKYNSKHLHKLITRPRMK